MGAISTRIAIFFFTLTFFFSYSIAPVLATVTYLYDANGNMTSDGEHCYTYNEANKLTRVKNCSNNQTIAEYVYDYKGNRKIKKEYQSGSLLRTIYSPDDGYETVKLASNGATQNTSYFFANDQLIAKKDPSGNKLYYHNDHLGSTGIITNQSGTVVEETTYDPWGEVKTGGTKSKFLYTGQERDLETNLHYYNARYYDPHIRHFIQGDPIISDIYDPQLLNRYAYVRNNPLRYTDPTGNFLNAALPAGVWIYGVIGGIGGIAFYSYASQGKAVVESVIKSASNIVTNIPSKVNNIVNTISSNIKNSNIPAITKNASSINTPQKTQPGKGSSQAPRPEKIDPKKWVTDNFRDPTKGPKGWNETVYGKRGPNDRTYHNPRTGETLHPDLNHGPSKKPHWDYKDSRGKLWRIFENGDMILK